MDDIMHECNQLAAVQNEWFSEKIGEKYLVTTRHGGFAVLNAADYKDLMRGTFNKGPLFEKLQNAGIILTNDNAINIIDSLKRQFQPLFLPKAYRINLSDECNLNCVYCHANSKSGKGSTMDAQTVEQTCKFLLSAPEKSLYVEFQGGEPLAKFDIVKMFLDKLKEGAAFKGKKVGTIVIVTNMVAMTEDAAKFILENNIGLCSSLDGPEELHDMHRRFIDGRGTYKAVTEWISYFRDRGKTINLLPTITRHSLRFDAKSIVDEYMKWGCKKVMFRAVYHIGRAKNNKGLHISCEDFLQFWKEGIEYMAALSEKGNIVYDPQIQAMLRNITGPARVYMCMRKPCGAGLSQISISPDGTIFPCDLAKSMPQLAMGTIYENYSDIAEKAIEMAARSIEAQPLCDTCAFGPYCGTCLASTFANFSDAVPRTSRDFECKVNKAMFTYLFEKLQDKRYRKVFEMWTKQKR